MKSAPSKLRVSVLPTIHMLEVNTNENGKSIISGFEGEFLNIILSKLKQNYEVVVPADGEYGRLNSNGSWTGMIGMLHNNEADMAISLLSITKMRLRVVDFSTSYTTEEGTFVIEKVKKESLNLAYLSPFDISTWMCFLVSMIALTFLFRSMLNKKMSYGQILFGLIASILRQPVSIKYDTSKSKGLLALWLLFALICSASYSAIFFLILTVPSQENPVRNFQELSMAVQKGSHQCFTNEGTNTIQFLQGSEEEHLVNLGRTIEQNKWYIRSGELGTGVHVSGNSVEQLSRTVLTLLYRFHSNYLISSDSLASWPIAIAMNKNFCCKSKLNVIISRLANAGIYDKILKDLSFRIFLSVYKTDFEQVNNKTLSIKDLSGVFLILVIGYIVSILVLLVEIFMKFNIQTLQLE